MQGENIEWEEGEPESEIGLEKMITLTELTVTVDRPRATKVKLQEKVKLPSIDESRSR